MALKFEGAKLLGSFLDPEKLPDYALPEVAFIGRSNVGKSTLINRLLKIKIARVSSTPGRTQTINLYQASFSLGANKRHDIVLTDLPGFGFAKLGVRKQARIISSASQYLVKRERLALVLLLNDCRRDPGEEEIDLRNGLFENDLSSLIILTKCDKLGRGELKKRTLEVSKFYGLEPQDVICSGENMPPKDIWSRIFSQLSANLS